MNEIFIPARSLNGWRVASVGIDTGSTFTSISRAFANRIQAAEVGRRPVYGIQGIDGEVFQAREVLVTLGIGNRLVHIRAVQIPDQDWDIVLGVDKISQVARTCEEQGFQSIC